jgi:FAD/FMN-containing dehydrogenase
MEEFGVGATFPNFIEPDEGKQRLLQSFGPEKYERLAQLKREWDPDNLFKLNQNIAPAA